MSEFDLPDDSPNEGGPDYDKEGNFRPLDYPAFREYLNERWDAFKQTTERYRSLLYTEYRKSNMPILEFMEGAEDSFGSVLGFLQECAAGNYDEGGPEDCWSKYELVLVQDSKQYFSSL
jgi:hypothetical protein